MRDSDYHMHDLGSAHRARLAAVQVLPSGGHHHRPGSIVVILMFTLVFCAMLSAFTRAKRHEILAASAG